MNLPNRPSRSMSFPSRHSGHDSPVSFGPSRSVPSMERIPLHSGKREQLKNFPDLPSFTIIVAPHTGHMTPSGASPSVVIFSMSFLDATSAENGP